MHTCNIEKQINSKILFNVKIEIKKKKYLITGDNGTGKSTFALILSGLDKQYSGEYEIGNNSICYQAQNLSLLDILTVKQNIDILCMGKINSNYCNLLFMDNIIKSNKVVSKLSGGEKQKLQLLINLSNDADIYIFDEIDNNMDQESIINMISIFDKLDKTLFIITHNQDYYINLDCEHLDFNNKNVVSNNIGNEIISKDYEVHTLNKSKLKILSKYLTKSLVITLSITLISMFLLISPINNLYITYLESNPPTYNRFDEDVAIIYPPLNNSFLYTFGSDEWRGKIHQNFNQEFYETINNLDYVDKVNSITPLNSEMNELGIEIDKKSYNYNGQYNCNELDFSLSVSENLTCENEVEYTTRKILDSNELIQKTNKSYSFNFKEIIKGTYPKEQTNEILIDELSAIKFAMDNKLENLDDVINKIMVIEFINTEDINQKISKEYLIKGIYSKLDNQLPSEILFSFDPTSTLIKQNQPVYMSQAEYDESLRLYNEFNANDDVYGKLTPQQYGIYPALFVELKDPSFHQEFEDFLNDYDEYIQVESNHTRDNSAPFAYVENKFFTNFIYLVLIFIINIIIIIISKKIYLKDLKNLNNKIKYYPIKSYINELHKVYLKRIFIYTEVLIISFIIVRFIIIVAITETISGINLFSDIYYLWYFLSTQLIILVTFLIFKWRVK